MKKRKLFFFMIVTIMFFIGIILLYRYIAKGGFEKELIPDYTESQQQWTDIHGPYIKTSWKQDSAYAAFTPDNELLGCWSVAFAQVLAFHKLAPAGKVNYITQNGKIIDQEFNIPVRWDWIRPSIKSSTSPEVSEEIANYCFNVAAVVQKDFGIGDYKDISIIPDEVSDHFRCVVKKADSDLQNKIRSEIHSGRPVVVYFDDILALKIVRNGHAAVFDGSAEAGNDMYIHVNFGWGGESDGWFKYNTLVHQRELLYIFTVMPL